MELVKAVHLASPSEQETMWLEWKLPLDLDAASGRATIAKAILGFSNRDPDVASRAMEGCAYLLVGVAPGTLRSVVPVDQAKLEAGVTVYAGGDGDWWRVDYVELDSKTVLVVTVEPPRWGDPMRPVRKAYQPDAKTPGPTMSKGTIFVRHQASTDPAADTDIDMLNRRAARRPGSELEVQLRSTLPTELPRIDCRPETLAALTADDEAQYLTQAMTVTVDIRTSEQYEQEIRTYFDELRRKLPDVLKANVVASGGGKLQLEVFNPTETTFTNVRIEVWLPSYAGVYVWESDAEDAADRLPPRPRLRGASRSSPPASPWLAPTYFRSLVRPMGLPQLVRSANAVHLTFDPRDVSPEGTAPLDEVWVVLDTDAPEVLPIRWEATATPARKRLRDGIEVPVSSSVLTPTRVLTTG